MSTELAIGIDLGGTAVKACLATASGVILQEIQQPTRASGGPEQVITLLTSMIATFEETARGTGDLRGIGVGAPGSIVHEEGRVISPPNLPDWHDVPLGPALQEKSGMIVFVENDANAAALGEAHFGASKDAPNSMLVTIGTGVGSGIILDRKLWRGEHGFAGEIGHVSIDAEGPACNCGSRGCLEAYVGAAYLTERAAAFLRHHPESPLTAYSKDELTPKILADSARNGDRASYEILYEAGLKTGLVLAGIVNILDITTILIGGGIAAAGKPLFDGIDTSLNTYVIAPLRGKLSAQPARLGNKAGMLGATVPVFSQHT